MPGAADIMAIVRVGGTFASTRVGSGMEDDHRSFSVVPQPRIAGEGYGPQGLE